MATFLTYPHARTSSALTLPLLIFILDALLSQAHLDAVASEVDKYLEMGRKMMAAGQLADALTHYHAAIDHDPSNYMTYFRRATGNWERGVGV